MFYSFASQTERRELGGSDFLELQICKMPCQKAIEAVVAVDSIENWKDDSLYIRGEEAGAFLEQYGPLLGDGIYNNLKTGPADPFGINYYRPVWVERIIGRLLEAKPAEFDILLEWLRKTKNYNGFYLLGI